MSRVISLAGGLVYFKVNGLSDDGKRLFSTHPEFISESSDDPVVFSIRLSGVGALEGILHFLLVLKRSLIHGT